MSCAISIASSRVGVQAQVEVPDDVRRDPQLVASGREYTPLYVPIPLEFQALEGYSEALRLSDEQRPLMEAFFGQYRMEWLVLREEKLSPLVRRSGEVGSGGLIMAGDMEAANERYHLLVDCEKAFGEVVALDDRFFSSIEAMLSEDQHGQLKLVRDRRARQRIADARLPYRRFGTRVDLSAILDEIGFGEIPLNSHGRYAELRTKYESKLTDLLRKHLGQFWNAVQQSPLFTARKATLTPEDSGARLELTRQTDRIQGSAMRIETRIDDLNACYVEWFAEVLPPDVARQLKFAFFSGAYPEAYPNPHDISPIFEAALTIIDEELRPAVIELQHASFEEQEQLSGMMVSRARQWLNTFQFHMAYAKSDFERYKSDLQVLQARRQKQSESWLGAIAELLGPEKYTPLIAHVSRHRQALADREPPSELNMSFLP